MQAVLTEKLPPEHKAVIYHFLYRPQQVKIQNCFNNALLAAYQYLKLHRNYRRGSQNV